jgi:hypothetical protein
MFTRYTTPACCLPCLTKHKYETSSERIPVYAFEKVMNDDIRHTTSVLTSFVVMHGLYVTCNPHVLADEEAANAYARVARAYTYYYYLR